MSKYHYVYHSYEEWGREYIGCRTCDCLPEEDTKYFGSFKDKTFFPMEKTILFVCETRQEASEIEIKLHDFFDVAVNPKFANKAKATSTKFDTAGVPRTETQKKAVSEKLSGRTLTEEHKKKISEATSGEKNCNHDKFGALHHNSKAMIAIEPDGTQRHFGSVREAGRELEINRGNLCKYLNAGHVLTQGPFKGWRFIYKNSEVLN